MSAHHAALNVGTPASGFKGWETTQIHYHGFADLTATEGEEVESPEFRLCGHQWRVDVYPGGDSHSDNGMVGVYLCNMSKKSIKVEFGFYIKDSRGKDVPSCCEGFNGSDTFAPADSSSDEESSADSSSDEGSCGFSNFAKRSDVLSALVAGSLVIEIRMKRADSSAGVPPFVTEDSWNERVLSLFMDETTADIAFDVGEDSQQIADTRKRSQVAPVKFHAHRFILDHSAPMLAALCPPGDGVVSASIADVAPEVFRPLLSYLYGREVGEDDYKSHVREIVRAADRFDIVGLKLAAEAWYVKSTEINSENMMELLLYSDAKNLALLKEAVMDYMVANGEEVLQKVSLKEAPAGLLADVLAATAREKKKSTGDESNFTTMRISDLRKMAHEKGLGIDGSRETLIAALEQNK